MGRFLFMVSLTEVHLYASYLLKQITFMLEQAFYCLLQFFFSISDSGRRSHPSARVWQLQDKAVPPHAALSHISQTTVCLRNGPHQCQSQSCAALLPGAGGIYSEKGLKDPLAEVFRDARTLVLH